MTVQRVMVGLSVALLLTLFLALLLGVAYWAGYRPTSDDALLLGLPLGLTLVGIALARVVRRLIDVLK